MTGVSEPEPAPSKAAAPAPTSTQITQGTPATSLFTKEKALVIEASTFCFLALLFEALILAIYVIWFRYYQELPDSGTYYDRYYGVFRDVNIMIFFGFGFLMTFLRRYGFSAIGYTFVISALVVQWSVILEALVNTIANASNVQAKQSFDMLSLLNGLFCAGAVMISYGAVLGKATPVQLLIMGFLEPIGYWINFYVCSLKLEAFDIGGGYFIHMYGAYFGLTVCFFLTTKQSRNHPDETSCYSSDTFSLAGTLFLWLLWPSFNSATADPGSPRVRAAINTFLSLCGATVMSFVVSRIVTHWKFNPVHIQNSTLAGGVAMGIAAHLPLYPAAVLVIGLFTGLVSVLGYQYLSPLMSRYLFIHDVCGIHNLHGMPSIIASIVGIVGAAVIEDTEDLYPQGSSGRQTAVQAISLGVTLAIGIAGGIVTGIVMWLTQYVYTLFPEDHFNDTAFWHVPSDYDDVVISEPAPPVKPSVAVSSHDDEIDVEEM